MCLDIPIKIHSVDKDKNVFVMFGDKKVKVSDVMVKVQEGDYVYLRDKLILAKISDREVEEVMKLVN